VQPLWAFIRETTSIGNLFIFRFVLSAIESAAYVSSKLTTIAPEERDWLADNAHSPGG
jgi:hypothetical protein